MKLRQMTLNGGAGILVHAVDREQKTCRAFPKKEALCGRVPGGGKTRMGASRSRWRQVGICASDTNRINCEKCLKKLEELNIDPESVER